MHSSCFEGTKWYLLDWWLNHFCMRCSVFENGCSALESRQFGGALWVMLLSRYKRNESWRKPMARTNWMRNCDVPLEISNQIEGKPNSRLDRLWLFNINYIWSRLLRFLLPSLIALARKESSLFPRFALALPHFPPFLSAITAVCKCHVHFCNKVWLNKVRRLNQLPNLIIWVDPNWYWVRHM